MSRAEATPVGPVRSLIDMLDARVDRHGDATMFNYVDGAGAVTGRLSMAGLQHESRRVAGFLTERGLDHQPVLLAYPPGIDAVVAFLGVMSAGSVPVPVKPPHRADDVERIAGIAHRAGSTVLLTPESSAARVVGPMADGAAHLATVVDDGSGAPIDPPRPAPDDIAFVQFTSGSTSAPKGVVVTHRNLLANSDAIRTCYGNTERTVGVSWLPAHHDMGLIGGFLQPLYSGFVAHFMSPLTFMQRPARWLNLISSVRATVSGAPNFAYELCADRVRDDQLVDLDLSSWTVAFCGAERIDPGTIDRFHERFSPHGFARSSFRPCYGLAEATLIVTGTSPGATVIRSWDRGSLDAGLAVASDDDSSRAIVSCGHPQGDTEVVIADPVGEAVVGDGTVGEIWVRGAAIALGYIADDEQTRERFHASLPGREGDRFLRTKDLGFMHDGELFVLGRADDVMNVRGRNVHPEDIEADVVRAHDDVTIRAVAAFAVLDDQTDGVAVALELPTVVEVEQVAIKAAIRAAVVASHGLGLVDVVVVGRGALPRTTSGKVKRSECARQHHAGVLGQRRKQRAATEAGAPAPAREPVPGGS